MFTRKLGPDGLSLETFTNLGDQEGKELFAGKGTLQLIDEALGTTVGTDVTDTNGEYEFDITLPLGTYKIVEVVDEAMDLGLLDGNETAGVNGGIVDNWGDHAPATKTGESSAFNCITSSTRLGQRFWLVVSDSHQMTLNNSIDFSF